MVVSPQPGAGTTFPEGARAPGSTWSDLARDAIPFLPMAPVDLISALRQPPWYKWN